MDGLLRKKKGERNATCKVTAHDELDLAHCSVRRIMWQRNSTLNIGIFRFMQYYKLMYGSTSSLLAHFHVSKDRSELSFN